MATYALVEPSGRVAQVENSVFPVSEPFKWVECGEEIDINYTYIDGEFIARTPDDTAA